ncbi:hypothetical protein M2323_004480 [Rhodoblastus acidophilus]|uniref:hypothetical protein n=1 Tax=Rhodoblastus acidophilus TaxID=1074 RepID=UPI002224C558|nr:hypothetical protein [Rhodoblastus acidophilus]MCW2286711.1 hypothetical protein [Rhodoblastus acidophilus]MCW2335531.1 hypothetical protein [Rhodoblastus acidophilus]
MGSAFEPFLYAVLYEDGHGMPLTTLSAIARSRVDPWRAWRRSAATQPRSPIADRLFALFPPARKNKIALPVVQTKPHWSPLVSVLLILLLILTVVSVFRTLERPAAPVAEKADP